MSRIALTAIVCCVLTRAGVAHAVPASELLARAERAASHDDFNTAARALEELVAGGIDSNDVLYDLGTVYARAGRFGEAIYRFEQINRRAPFALDAQQNLRAVRLRLAHRDAGRSGRAVVETALPFGVWLAELLPLEWALVLALLCEIGAIAGLIAFRKRKGGEVSRVAGAAAGVLLGAGAVLFATMILARQWDPPSAIVLHDGLRVLRSPNADAIPEGALREGERVEVVGREAAFVRVRAPDGAQGWLASRDLGMLTD